MCGMFFTFDEENIPLLKEYNSRRGGINESITEFDLKGKKAFVGHYQAPTSVVSRTHPNVYEKQLKDEYFKSSIWHNGIIKEIEIERLKKLLNESNEEWDTALLHKMILMNHGLSDVDGSFALFLSMQFDEDIDFYFCRNAIAPLYINREKMILSSAKVPELGVTEMIEHGNWFTFRNTMKGLVMNKNFSDSNRNMMRSFSSKHNPYNI